MILAVLGRQPELSLAELEAVFGDGAINAINEQVCTLDVPGLDIDRFGGLLKVGDVINHEVTKSDEGLISACLNALPSTEAKITVGFSWYGTARSTKSAFALALELKKRARKQGLALRVVPNKELALSAAQSIHNGLMNQNGVEFIIAEQSNQYVVAKASQTQDIENYAKRDHGRPARDAKVGMLPPKLAQIMLNLATGPMEEHVASSKQHGSATRTNKQDSQGLDGYKEDASSAVNGTGNVPRMSNGASDAVDTKSSGRVGGFANKQAAAALRILDPFCGTGVVLQEALLMGFNACGSDIEQRMVDMAMTNLNWLGNEYPVDASNVNLQTGDARILNWDCSFEAVVSEIYLGPPLTQLPPPEKLQKIAAQVDALLVDTLKNIARSAKSGVRLCLAVPAWQSKDSHVRLPRIDALEDIGYNLVSFKAADNKPLIYAREGQVVARELLVLERS